AFFTSRSEQLAALALRYAVPTIYWGRGFFAAGGKGAFAAMMRRMPNALVLTGDALHRRYVRQILDFAAQDHLPVVSQEKEIMAAGALLSYGADLSDLLRQGALYVHKILQGSRPADLPIEQPTHFKLGINLKTARALGLEVPPTLLARADEVIE